MRAFMLTAVAAAAILAAGCSLMGRTTHHETMNGEESSYGSSLSLASNPDEAMLDRGKQAVMENRFDDAAALFKGLADKASAEQEYREAALFELAELQTNVLNPNRDPAKALALFRKFVELYPDSKLADQAREQIERLGGGD